MMIGMSRAYRQAPHAPQLSWMAVLVNVALALAWTWANTLHLDEAQRTLQLALFMLWPPVMLYVALRHRPGAQRGAVPASDAVDLGFAHALLLPLSVTQLLLGVMFFSLALL